MFVLIISHMNLCVVVPSLLPGLLRLLLDCEGAVGPEPEQQETADQGQAQPSLQPVKDKEVLVREGDEINVVKLVRTLINEITFCYKNNFGGNITLMP